MTDQIAAQRSKRRWGLFGAGCSSLLMIPMLFMFLLAVVGVFTAKSSAVLGLILVLLIFAAMIYPLGQVVLSNVKRANEAKQNIEVLTEKMEAQGGSLSVSQPDASGALTNVQEHDLSSVDKVFDFDVEEEDEVVEQSASIQSEY